MDIKSINGTTILTVDTDDLCDADLINVNLNGADLRWINLSRANLFGANLRGANLRGVDLINVNLNGADLNESDLRAVNLSRANLSNANLFAVNLSNANLSNANLSNANLINANLGNANLSGADLSRANLFGANLRGANLSGADLSRSKGITKASDWLKRFYSDSNGIYVFKTFGVIFDPPEYWEIKEGSILEETVNYDRGTDCASGINFGTQDYCRSHCKETTIWMCLIEWPDVADVVVPFNTDGKARCSRLTLIKKVEEVETP